MSMTTESKHPRKTPDSQGEPASFDDLHEIRNWMLAAQLSVAEVKEQLIASNLNLESIETVELALSETIALLK